MIKISNLDKTFASQDIFDDVSLNMNPGERIGLSGRNGHGKTTLFKMIIGEEHPDSGSIEIPRHYTIGYLSQKIEFTGKTVIEEGCLDLGEKGEQDKWRVEKILFGLGFTKDDMLRDPMKLSGGFQIRLNLAKVLVSEPNLLLLDEPTNYLDIVSIRWLSNFLRNWRNELMLITHDRSFMDSVITHTAGIHRKKIKKIEGTTDKLYEQILREEEVHEKTRVNDEKKKKETELFIKRFRAKARLAGLVQSRIKSLEKQDKLDRLEKIKTLDFSFSYNDFNAKVVLTAKGLSFSYNQSESPLINDFSITIGKSDRICVVGKNGKGKTTLLKLLSGDMTPQKGEITTHANTQTGYFAQTNTSKLSDTLTVEQEIIDSGCDRQRARNICGAMMFEGDMALKKIGVISGGEKSRVLLGKLLAEPANILLLDEPTNHLDMESCDALLAAIDNFEGAVVIVTHNEMFLNTIANRFVVFQNNEIKIHEGSYKSFLEKVGWEGESELKSTNNSALNGKNNIINKKDLRKIKADIQKRRSAELNPINIRIKEVENLIEKHEDELNIKNGEMVDASSGGDSSRITELSKEIHGIRTTIDNLYDEFEQLTIDFDEKSISFDRETDELNSN
ncbi:ATP-binding cassette domain-containing protein [Spirochaetota bacterium]